jgi:adenine phosphoribosyltransferase
MFNRWVAEPIDLASLIRAIPDFPTPGILFRDITPVLRQPAAFQHVLDRMVSYARSRNVEVVLGIESRGFLFGTPLADRLGLPFVPVRKPGKLPSARRSVAYSLEYGEGQLDIHADAIAAGDRVLVVDDLLATGGTAAGAAHLVEQLGGEVAGIVFMAELLGLGGRDRLAAYDVLALVSLT